MKESAILDIIYDRICDVFKKKVVNDISNASKCMLYKHVVDYFCLQVYRKISVHVKYRKLITRLRLSSHDLKIETGRYDNLKRDCQKCDFCNINEIEDEFHFLLICPSLRSLREKYVKKYYSRKPSVYKLYSYCVPQILKNCVI